MVSPSVTTLLATAGLVGALGVLIKYFGMVRLIAGYDPDRVTDEEGLADFIGTHALYVAGLVFLVAIVEYAEPFDGSDAMARVRRRRRPPRRSDDPRRSSLRNR